MSKKSITSNKEIVALSEYEHIRLRSGMYVGTTHETEEKIAIIRNGLLIQETKILSVALYKLLNEILDNSFDALKRDQIENGIINVRVESANNKVTISDNAHGFHNPSAINKVTGVSNVETALTQLRAGSNFFNDNSDDSIIGTNGVGSAIVNILSTHFSVVTINETEKYTHTWENFKTTVQDVKKSKNEKTGTTIEYVPDVTIFKTSKYDVEYLTSQMVFRNFLLKKDSALSKTKLKFYFDEIEINLDTKFLPDDYIELDSQIGSLIIYPSFPNATSVSFINSTITSGIHQKIVNDNINQMFGVPNAHHFYETIFCLNLPPKLIRFSDQNKTKYAGTRSEVEPLILHNWLKKLKRDFQGSEIFDEIFKNIEESTRVEDLKKIQKEKKKSKARVSDKYFPCSGEKVSIFLCEGHSAAGSLMQKRDAKTEAVYALKGKVKNARRLSDLSSNAEIIDLMTILGLEMEKKSGCSFKNVIIATDADPDGHHISSLLINFFYKWFPHVILERRLNILITPLVSAEVNGKLNYFYSNEEFDEVRDKAKSVRYLKGLGSLNQKDWEKIMKEKKTYLVRECTRTERSLKIAFGENAGLRKKWLAS